MSQSSSSSSDDGKSEGPVTEAKKKKGLGLVIPHPVQGAMNFLCAVLGLLTCLLRTELVHLLEVTHRIKGIILRIAQPLHDVFDFLISFLWASHRSRNRTVLICRLERWKNRLVTTDLIATHPIEDAFNLMCSIFQLLATLWLWKNLIALLELSGRIAVVLKEP